MTDEELRIIALEALRTAHEYECDGACKRPDDTPGEPPDGWWDNASAFLAERGYTLSREPITVESEGLLSGFRDGILDGITTGPSSRDVENRSTVKINSRLLPVRTFGVTVHESAHVVLSHVEGNTDIIKFMNLLIHGIAEDFEEELTAELTGLCVLRAAGLPVPGITFCTLSQKVRLLGGLDAESSARIAGNAVDAAKMLIPVLLGVKV
jgi:hypothetical protein